MNTSRFRSKFRHGIICSSVPGHPPKCLPPPPHTQSHPVPIPILIPVIIPLIIPSSHHSKTTSPCSHTPPCSSPQLARRLHPLPLAPLLAHFSTPLLSSLYTTSRTRHCPQFFIPPRDSVPTSLQREIQTMPNLREDTSQARTLNY